MEESFNAEISHVLSQLPKKMDSFIRMDFPNQEVIIFEGDLIYQFNNKSVKGTGKIYAKWLPKNTVNFIGKIQNDLLFDSENVIICIEPMNLKARVLVTESNNKGDIAGLLNDHLLVGNKDSIVDVIKFELLNIKDFHGISTTEGSSLLASRLTFSNGITNINIDIIPSPSQKRNKLKQESGYVLLGTGAISALSSQPIKYESLNETLDCFACFLGFINGRRIAPVFRKGFLNGEEQCYDFTAYINDPYQRVTSCAPYFYDPKLSDIWKEFYNAWNNDIDRECLTLILHWYVEANSQAAYVDGSIVLIQNALELLFNWLNEKGIINGKENDKAVKKIRCLLTLCSIPHSVPSALTNLTNIAQSLGINDGPEALTLVRNALVHSNKQKREKYQHFTSIAKYELLQMGIWYVELCLLHFLKYDGEYTNRVSGDKWFMESRHFVPWSVT